MVEHDNYATFRSSLPLEGIRTNDNVKKRETFETIKMDRGAEVSGTVVDPDGQPCENLQIRLRWLGATGMRSVGLTQLKTNAEGRFRAVVPLRDNCVLTIVSADYTIIDKGLAK